MKYEEDAIHTKDDILKALSTQFDDKAEEIIKEEGREKVTNEDMNKAILIVLVEKGSRIMQTQFKKEDKK